jgi:chemosensory pili system protein ChpC
MSSQPGVVRSLFLPLVEGGLIVPISVVAELVAFERPVRRPEMPAWMAGTIAWRGQGLPVCFYEAALGQNVPDCGERARIAVFHGLQRHENLDYFGVVIQGLPSMVLASHDNIVRESSIPPAFAAAQVSVDERSSWIPDTDRLEDAIAPYVAVAR